MNIELEPLTPDAFLEFGDVITVEAASRHFPINGGTTERYHDISTAVAFGEDARVILSIARAQPFELPLLVPMLERHPEGSQAFVPLDNKARFIVVVAPDKGGAPGTPRAFLADKGQGVNYFRATWHGVLTTLDRPTDFLVVDRDGLGSNLEEHHLSQPVTVTA